MACTLPINGIYVEFPITPYPVQIEMISRVIDCCKNGSNGLLEMPTGTGKTMACLLGVLSSMNEQRSSGDAMSRLLWCSRTHMQLKQAVDELSMTSYATRFRSTCLGSRAQLCINESVTAITGRSSASEQIQACKEQRYKSHCRFYRTSRNYTDVLTRARSSKHGVADIEELTAAGGCVAGCPYYASLSSAVASPSVSYAADIIFSPYSYLFNKDTNIMSEELVIVFDEGHNFVSMCTEAYSAEITRAKLTNSLSAVSRIPDLIMMKEQLNREGKRSVEFILESLESLFLEKRELDKHGVSFFANHFFSNEHTIPALQEATMFLSDVLELASYAGGNHFFPGSDVRTVRETITGIGDVLSFIRKLIPPDASATGSEGAKAFLRNHFGVSLKQDVNNGIDSVKLHCLDPALAVAEMKKKGFRSLILLSGTLSPFDHYENELGIKFQQRMSRSHVIGSNQLKVFRVSSYNKKTIDGRYLSVKKNPSEYQDLIGDVVIDVVRVIPHGVIVFFKSYESMSNAVTRWSTSGVIGQIDCYKNLFQETRDRESHAFVVSQYCKAVDDGKGAVLFAVMRGRLAEGVNLKDNHCRAVIIVGLPYPALFSPEVVLKKRYLDQKRVLGNSGNSWYNAEMFRALNQSIGRIIRHAKDFGLVFLVDKGFREKPMCLSPWLRPFVSEPQDAIASAKEFISVCSLSNNATICEETHSRGMKRRISVATNGSKEAS